MESSLPRKQRKARYDAHITARRKQMAASIDPELRKNMAERKKPILYPRSLPVRKGDRVRVVRGQEFRPNDEPVEKNRFRDKPRGKTFKITGVDARRRKIHVENKTYRKKDMSEIPYPIDPSNVVIVNPDWSDPFRRKILNRLNEGISIEEVETAEDEHESEHYEVGTEEQPEDAEEEAAEEADLEESSAEEDMPAEVEALAETSAEDEDLAQAKEAETDENDENEPAEASQEAEVVEPETGKAEKED